MTTPTLWCDPAPVPAVADDPTAQAPAVLLTAAATAGSAESFQSVLLSFVAGLFPTEGAAVAVADQGAWFGLARFGRIGTLPSEFLGDVLDRGRVGAASRPEGIWLAAPLESRRTSVPVLCLLVGRGADLKPEELAARFARLIPAATTAWQMVQDRLTHERRIERLQAVLECSIEWNRSQDMESLLTRMAESAARLLDADRASIFLWDKAGKQLVGRPALGVPSGELRVSDQEGLVGRVLQTGRPERVHEGHQAQLISRQTDRQLGYRTRSLACVPLNGRDGRRFGVFEVLNKKHGVFTEDDLEALSEIASHAAVALENTREREALLESRRKITEEAAGQVNLIGGSLAIEALRSTVSRVAATELAVLVLGENGTGKEVVSRLIHYLSPRRDQPFIAVNCAAISETLLESELFGHEKGAFTDAHELRRGKFESASGGTIFLDEIGDLSPGGQAKLLRVLEERVVVRVGGSKSIHCDVRVVAATNQDLPTLVRDRKFRQDLYFRLNVVSIELPPLRERGEDVLRLAEHFLTVYSRSARRKLPLELTDAARRRLLQHPWPGNVRELRNLIERLAYLHPGERADADDLVFAPSRAAALDDVPSPRGPQAVRPLGEATDDFQRECIRRAVELTRGNMSDAAKMLGLHRSNLYRKMRQLEMIDGAPAEADAAAEAERA